MQRGGLRTELPLNAIGLEDVSIDLICIRPSAAEDMFANLQWIRETKSRVLSWLLEAYVHWA